MIFSNIFKNFAEQLFQNFFYILLLVSSLCFAIVAVDLMADYSFLSISVLTHIFASFLALIFLHILPVVAASAVFLTITKMIRNREQIASQSLGLSYTRQLVWIVCFAILVSICCAGLWHCVSWLNSGLPNNLNVKQSEYPALFIKKVNNKTVVSAINGGSKNKFNDLLIISLEPNTITLWSALTAHEVKENQWQLNKGKIYSLDKSLTAVNFDRLNYQPNGRLKAKKLKTMSIVWRDLFDSAIMVVILSIIAFNVALSNVTREHKWRHGGIFFVMITLYFTLINIINSIVLPHFIMFLLLFKRSW